MIVKARVSFVLSFTELSIEVEKSKIPDTDGYTPLNVSPVITSETRLLLNKIRQSLPNFAYQKRPSQGSAIDRASPYNAIDLFNQLYRRATQANIVPISNRFNQQELATLTVLEQVNQLHNLHVPLFLTPRAAIAVEIISQLFKSIGSLENTPHLNNAQKEAIEQLKGWVDKASTGGGGL